MHIQRRSHLSDPELIAEVKRLACCEREVTANLVACIAEMDRRRLHRPAGFPSLFAYCREVLELSEQSTYNRIEAARAAGKFPVILDMLSQAAVTLATVRLLAPHLTPDNHAELLQAASHKSKREVERLLARLFPQPDVPASMRKVRAARATAPSPMIQPAPVPSGEPSASPPPPLPSHEQQSLSAVGGLGNPVMESGPTDQAPSAAIESMPTTMSATPRPTTLPVSASMAGGVPRLRQAMRPLAEDRFEIRFTAPASTCEKLKLAQDLLRHAVPTGDMADVIDRALTALLENLAKQKFAATAHPRNSAGPGAGSRPIPADVRRKVWLRDQGRCRFTSTTGRRCGSAVSSSSITSSPLPPAVRRRSRTSSCDVTRTTPTRPSSSSAPPGRPARRSCRRRQRILREPREALGRPARNLPRGKLGRRLRDRPGPRRQAPGPRRP